MTTWKLKEANLSGEQLTITLTEVIDSVDTRDYSVAGNKELTKAQFAALFKTKINADRAKRSTEETLKTKLDLTGFETYLNQ